MNYFSSRAFSKLLVCTFEGFTGSPSCVHQTILHIPIFCIYGTAVVVLPTETPAQRV